MTFEDFQKTHGKSWYQLINSQMWRDARAAIEANCVHRKLTGVEAADIRENGVVYAANIQGQMDVMQAMETQLVLPDALPQPPQENYGNDYSTGNPPPPRKTTRKGRK